MFFTLENTVTKKYKRDPIKIALNTQRFRNTRVINIGIVTFIQSWYISYIFVHKMQQLIYLIYNI